MRRKETIGARELPPKIRELVKTLEKAGFYERGGKGIHRNYVPPKLSKPITISGKLGDDAKKHQMRAVERAVQEAEE